MGHYEVAGGRGGFQTRKESENISNKQWRRADNGRYSRYSRLRMVLTKLNLTDNTDITRSSRIQTWTHYSERFNPG